MLRDLAIDLIRSGYDAIPNARHDHGGRSSFPTRVLGRTAAVIRGEDAARHFYDRSAVRRRSTMPPPLAHLLFGRGTVHGLDGRDHLDRKQLFLEILTEESTDELSRRVGHDLDARSHGWPGRRIGVFDELVSCYGLCVQTWAGIEQPSDAMNRELALIVDGFGGAGGAYPRAWLARRRVDRRAQGLIADVRRGRKEAPQDTPLDSIALGRGAGLSTRLAGVELGNILRPTVALAAKATRSAKVDGVDIRSGQRLVLDVPGTNTDPRFWSKPETFDPEKFLTGALSEFEYLPQGGGHPESGHRCPGEALTVKLMGETLRVFAGTGFTTPAQVAHETTRIPTTPAGGPRIDIDTTRRLAEET